MPLVAVICCTAQEAGLYKTNRIYKKSPQLFSSQRFLNAVVSDNLIFLQSLSHEILSSVGSDAHHGNVAIGLFFDESDVILRVFGQFVEGVAFA